MLTQLAAAAESTKLTRTESSWATHRETSPGLEETRHAETTTLTEIFSITTVWPTHADTYHIFNYDRHFHSLNFHAGKQTSTARCQDIYRTLCAKGIVLISGLQERWPDLRRTKAYCREPAWPKTLLCLLHCLAPSNDDVPVAIVIFKKPSGHMLQLPSSSNILCLQVARHGGSHVSQSRTAGGRNMKNLAHT